MLGDFLYQLTAKDAQTQPVIQRNLVRAGVSTAAAGINLDSPPIPNDKIGILTNVNLNLDPGAAQTVVAFTVQVVDSVGNNLGNIFGGNPDPSVAAGGVVNYRAQCEVILMPNELVRAGVVFSGAVANLVVMDLHILLLPRGNIQFR